MTGDGFTYGDSLATLERILSPLRRALLVIALALGAGTVVGYFCAPAVMGFLFRPAGQVIFTGPAEAFATRLKVSFLLAACMALPLAAYQVFTAYSPCLARPVRRLLAVCLAGSIILFYAGASFATFLAAPLAIRFLLRFGTTELQPLLSAARCLSFVTSTLLAFGVLFQLPLAVTVLARLGLVSPNSMRARRRYVILLIFIAAAVLTPADAFSMFLMAIPLLVLYELGILMATLASSRRKSPASQESAPPGEPPQYMFDT